MRKIMKENYMRIVTMFVLALLCFSMIWGGRNSAPIVYAKNTEYTSVLEDLKKDKSFSESYYPVDSNDYSLKMVQIAESSNKELFVYLYQPSGQAKDFRASSINISMTINDEISYRNYKLTYISSAGTLYKYLVRGLTVNTEPVRYYAISTVYRPFDKTIDESAEHGNNVEEIDYLVAKQYCFGTINGKPYVQVVDIETITVTDKFVGFVRYKDGFQLYVGACDSHFMAFNTDKPMDKLLEADVYYTSQEYSWSFAVGAGENETFYDKKDNYAYLKYTDKVEHTGGGWFAGTYKWDRIQTVETFIANENMTQNVYSGALIDVSIANKITDEGLAALKGKKWVLRFAETSYSSTSGGMSTTAFSTLVGDVTILRLKFETDGVTYNLGVIDNKQTGGDKPVNDEEIIISGSEGCKSLLSVLAFILLLIVLMPFLPYIIKGIIWIISLPFRLVASIVKAFKKKK